MLQISTKVRNFEAQSFLKIDHECATAFPELRIKKIRFRAVQKATVNDTSKAKDKAQARKSVASSRSVRSRLSQSACIYDNNERSLILAGEARHRGRTCGGAFIFALKIAGSMFFHLKSKIIDTILENLWYVAR